MNHQRAKARSSRPTADLRDAESVKRSLCASLFTTPSIITHALSHEITGRFSIEPHEHEDLIQFDMIDGCVGDVFLIDRTYTITGTTLMVTYPTETHGYTLIPDRPPSNVYHFKLRTSDPWHRLGRRPLPRLQTHLPMLEQLSTLLDSSANSWTNKGVPSTSLAQLAQAICLWPVSGLEAQGVSQALGHSQQGAGQSASDRVRQAIETLGCRHHNPPDLTELASFAKLSSRHFARRFQADFNCTPHDYMTARRLDTARSLLLRPNKRIHEVADELCFSSAAAFSRWFTKLTSQGPRAFQQDPKVF